MPKFVCLSEGHADKSSDAQKAKRCGDKGSVRALISGDSKTNIHINMNTIEPSKIHMNFLNYTWLL